MLKKGFFRRNELKQVIPVSTGDTESQIGEAVRDHSGISGPTSLLKMGFNPRKTSRIIPSFRCPTGGAKPFWSRGKPASPDPLTYTKLCAVRFPQYLLPHWFHRAHSYSSRRALEQNLHLPNLRHYLQCPSFIGLGAQFHKILRNVRKVGIKYCNNLI